MLYKKDFIKISDILRRYTANKNMVDEFATFCEQQNKSFDKESFKNHCGRQ